jgi:hypothetical protein
MITAFATEHHGLVRLEIVRPDKPKHEFLTVDNYAEADRRMYVMNRDYVIDKLTKWLRLRMYAMKLAERPQLTIGAAKLLVLLSYYKNATLPAVTTVVAGHMAALELLIPGERSSHYPNYKNTIAPILDYCRKNGGAAQS